MSKKVCVIGAGQLGSRHLQALAGVKDELSFYVIDPFEASLTTAKDRFLQVASPEQTGRAVFATDMSVLPEELDLVIVASTSAQRRGITEELLGNRKVTFLVLEKWLCAAREDLDAMAGVINATGTKTWINCCMRMMPFYEEVKQRLGEGPAEYNVTGTQFGLITNLIHYADFLAWISGCNDFSTDLSAIIREMPESKRRGYFELNGTVTLHFTNGSTATITCNKEGHFPIMMQLQNDKKRVVIDEGNYRAFWQDDINSPDFEISGFSIPYQSQLSTVLAEELFKTGGCRLATFEESAHIHAQLMEAVTDFIRKELGYTEREFPFT